MALQMRFFTGGETVQATALTALTLDKEIYTPYSQLRARVYGYRSCRVFGGKPRRPFGRGDPLAQRRR